MMLNLNDDDYCLIMAEELENEAIENRRLEIQSKVEKSSNAHIIHSAVDVNLINAGKRKYADIIKNMSTHWRTHNISSDVIKNYKVPDAGRGQMFSADEIDLIQYVREDSKVKTNGTSVKWKAFYSRYNILAKQLHLINREYKLFNRKENLFKESVKKVKYNN
jgi:hypothetical protein